MRFALAVSALLAISCSHRQARVARPDPNPTAGTTYLDLRPGILLKLENAYWEEGAARGGLAGYLGTEASTISTLANGSLKLSPVVSTLKSRRPQSQPPVDQLVPASARRARVYRFYYAVPFQRAGRPNVAVLLRARSDAQLDQLAQQLKAAPEQLCSGPSSPCTVFPESSTVSVQMEILANGTLAVVTWGSRASTVTGGHPLISLERQSATGYIPFKFPGDGLQSVLQPNDHLRW
jgi:hypothetical protein